jgi:hypothetical protein
MIHIPSAEQLVRAWEAGMALPHAARAIELLAAVDPETSRSDAAALSLGERDRRLLGLQRALFGPVLDATAGCPSCGDRVEFTVEVDSLLVAPPEAPAQAAVDVACVSVEFRLPTSADLLALMHAPSGLTGPALMTRCVSRVAGDSAEEAGSFVAIPEAARDAVASRMAALDPQADVQLSMSCPSCQHQWSSDFDVVSYLWSELTSWVRRLLVEVHQLALAYGWREADILAMSSRRRAVYLELIGA